MNHKNILHITAVTGVTPAGQKCVRAILEYSSPLAVPKEAENLWEVQDRHITGTVIEDNKVTLELDPADPAASTIHFGEPWMGINGRMDEASVKVKQTAEIHTADGQSIPASGEYMESDRTFDPLVDLFSQGQYGSQKYNLFIPENYDPAQKYPLVQFIHDAGVLGDDPRLALAQGLGALIWVTPVEQKKHPCFVYAPQFDGPPIVDDDWNVDPRLEESKAALDHILETYSIDRERIYTTGQSMGCMSSIVENCRYPDFFAASYLVAGQWDDRNIPNLEKQHLWMICSQGDAKAFPFMNQMCVNMEQKGAKIAHRVMEAGLPEEEYRRIAAEILKEKPDIIHTVYKLETVANGWHSNGGEHHMGTWTTAYGIETIRDWLFSQRKESKDIINE